MKVCSCGSLFTSADSRQRYCSRSCQVNTARKVKRSANMREFVGVDGEGVGTGADHKYVLLGCGQAQIENPDCLHWEEILSFLYDQFLLKPDAVYVGFFLGYDFAHWFRGLPAERARRIFTQAGNAARQRKCSPVPYPVDVGDWQIDALPGSIRRVKFRPQGEKRFMFINDAGPFFQSSFLKVIDPKGWDIPVVTQQEYDIVEEGKRKRSGAALDDSMRYYNRLENNILARVMTRYNEGLTKAGVKLRVDQWYGPGQASQEWMKNNNIPTGDQVREALPPDVHDFAVATYYGGWFEITCHGYIRGTLWEYDINSAYPHIMATLPCLLHGKWTSGKGTPPDKKNAYTMVRARVQGSSEYLGAMLHRKADSQRICRPRRTGGHYWLHELKAAKNAGLIDRIQFEKWHQYEPCSCLPPARGMTDLYQDRLAVGKDTPQGKAYKLIYNSAYGKFAQSVGHPRFSNAIYASLITAGCRKMILDAIATHPMKARGVAMIATDAVYFLRRHPSLPLGKALGEWEETQKQNVCLFKPGMYWDDKTRMAIQRGSTPVFKSRGISAKDFAAHIKDIDRHFQKWSWGIETLDAVKKRPTMDFDKSESMPIWQAYDWPFAYFTIEFCMVTIGQALGWNKWEKCGEILVDTPVTQDSFDGGIKRDLLSLYYDAEDKVWRSETWDITMFNPSHAETWSTPYDKRFGEELRENRWAFECTPEAPIELILTEGLGIG